MHKNRFIIAFLILAFIISYGNWAISAGVGVPSTVGECTAAQVEVYKITLTGFEVSNDNGASYTTVYESTGGATVDLASVSGSNTSAGAFFSSLYVDEGTITNIRVTFKSSFGIKGRVTYGGKTYRTKEGTNQLSLADGAAAEESIVYDSSLGADGSYTFTQNVSISITSGTNTVKITFNMTNAFGLMSAGSGYMIVPKEVTPTIERI